MRPTPRPNLFSVDLARLEQLSKRFACEIIFDPDDQPYPVETIEMKRGRFFILGEFDVGRRGHSFISDAANRRAVRTMRTQVERRWWCAQRATTGVWAVVGSRAADALVLFIETTVTQLN